MRIALHDHQNKGKPLARALAEAGHELTTIEPELLLIDFDGPEYYRRIIEHFDVPTVLYPHGATAMAAWDGIWSLGDEIAGYIAMSKGQADILRSYGFPRPVYEVGWWWCDIEPYRPAERLDRVLFAPIHPLNNGYIRPEVAEVNRAAFADLLAHICPDKISVRFIHSIEGCGLWREERVEYHQGQMDTTVEDIETADAVVGYGTFAHLAAARGKPVVMFGQDLPLWDGHEPGKVKFAVHWDDYREIIRYPVNSIAHLDECNREPAIYWRERMIGYPLDIQRLNTAIEEISHAAVRV